MSGGAVMITVVMFVDEGREGGKSGVRLVARSVVVDGRKFSPPLPTHRMSVKARVLWPSSPRTTADSVVFRRANTARRRASAVAATSVTVTPLDRCAERVGRCQPVYMRAVAA